MNAFWVLDTCRPLGFGAVGRIPWTAIARYAEVNLFTHDQYEMFLQLIMELDNVYVKHVNTSTRSAVGGDPGGVRGAHAGAGDQG